MLMINDKMHFIRSSKYEYLAKVGSISNYSFQLKDEEQSGMLEILIENTEFPISKPELIELLSENTLNIDVAQIEETIERLLEIEVLYETSQISRKEIPVCIITDEKFKAAVHENLQMQNIDVTYFVLDDGGQPSSQYKNVIDLNDEEQTKHLFAPFEYIIIFKTQFSPTTFYKLNKICLYLNKKLIISYLDGHEGVIVPLLNFNQVGCYNDFELLRESSFYNLLDYQVMKEQLIKDDKPLSSPVSLHFNSLILQTMLLFNHYTSYTNINYYAYSLDFERLEHTKSRLLKFPKCPSCQTDKNLVNAFI